MSGSRDSDEIAGAAQDWIYDLLRRELESRGQGEAAIELRNAVRFRLSQRESHRQGFLIRFDVGHYVTAVDARVNAMTGEPISWYFDFLAQHGDTSTPPDEALTIAIHAGQPPVDACLESAEYERVGDRVIFRARWTHVHEGLPVEGDFIEVLVNGRNRKAFAVTRVWRTPDLSWKAQYR